MRAIIAYIRAGAARNAVQRLHAAGASDISIVPIWSGDTMPLQLCGTEETARQSISPVVRIELMCADDVADLCVELLQSESSTGCRGDGRIFVMTVRDAVRIRDGRKGLAALRT